MIGLFPFSTGSRSGVDNWGQFTCRRGKTWNTALLLAAANFPRRPVVLLTTPANLPRSEAAQVGGDRKAAGSRDVPVDRRADHFKGARRSPWTRYLGCAPQFKSRWVAFLSGISACRPQVAPRNGKKSTFKNRCAQFSSFFSSCVLVISLKHILLLKDTAMCLWSRVDFTELNWFNVAKL